MNQGTKKTRAATYAFATVTMAILLSSALFAPTFSAFADKGEDKDKSKSPGAHDDHHKKGKKDPDKDKDNDRKECKNGDKNKNGKYKHDCDSDHDFKK